jgi:hypothetical protein
MPVYADGYLSGRRMHRGNPVTCTASDQCHVRAGCNPATGLCSNPTAANGTGCNDGNACTQTDTCQNGTCTGGNPKTCTALDQCHVPGTCNTSTGVLLQSERGRRHSLQRSECVHAVVTCQEERASAGTARRREPGCKVDTGGPRTTPSGRRT